MKWIAKSYCQHFSLLFQFSLVLFQVHIDLKQIFVNFFLELEKLNFTNFDFTKLDFWTGNWILQIKEIYWIWNSCENVPNIKFSSCEERKPVCVQATLEYKRIRNVALFLSIKLTVGKLQTVSCNLWVVFFHHKPKEREMSFKILFKCLFVIESIFVFIQYLQYSLNSTDYDTCVCVFLCFLNPYRYLSY